MVREITQFSTIEYNAAPVEVFEDTVKYDKPKHVAMRMFRTLSSEGKLEEFGGVRNIKTVRVLQEKGKDGWQFAYAFKKTLAEVKAEREKAELDKWEKDVAQILFELGPDIAAGVLATAAVIIVKSLGPRAPLEKVREAAPGAIRMATEQLKEAFKRMFGKPVGNTPRTHEKVRQGSKKPKGRWKGGPKTNGAPRPAQAFKKAS